MLFFLPGEPLLLKFLWQPFLEVSLRELAFNTPCYLEGFFLAFIQLYQEEMQYHLQTHSDKFLLVFPKQTSTITMYTNYWKVVNKANDGTPD